ncbi:MAG: hypothetical protein AB3N23_05585 [Paracoccaceae bacterium]
MSRQNRCDMGNPSDHFEERRQTLDSLIAMAAPLGVAVIRQVISDDGSEPKVTTAETCSDVSYSY